MALDLFTSDELVSMNNVNNRITAINDLFPTELYYNADGSTGNIILSSSVANYKTIEILFFIIWNNNSWYHSVKIYNNNTSAFKTNLCASFGATYNNDSRIKIYGSNIEISGTSITRIINKISNITGSNTTTVDDTTTDTPSIYRVLGYKY